MDSECLHVPPGDGARGDPRVVDSDERARYGNLSELDRLGVGVRRGR